MKKTFKALKFAGVILFIILSFISCEKDFNSLESDVLGKDNANFMDSVISSQISANNKNLEALQINNLSSSLLGVFNDPVYGSSTASIITQISPVSFSPNFGENPVIDSVILTIPYFSKTINADSDGNPIYSIQDSLYGDGSINLSIYQNNYFLRDFDPNSETNARQNYYSKADGSINTTDNFALTENSIINFDENKGVLIMDTIFKPSDKAIILKTGTGDAETVTRGIPAIRFHLDTDFWHTTILDKQGTSELSNENNFKNYFRGLYFKATPTGGDDNLVLLNMASTSSNITIYYSFDAQVAGERNQGTYTLNLASTNSININRLNTFINNYNTIDLDNNDKLYLKGAEGSMAVVDLFSGMVDCDGDGTLDMSALDCFIDTYRVPDGNGGYKKDNTGRYLLRQLINEAQLIVYEDENILIPSGEEDYHKYDRIYAYDIKNNTFTNDYFNDPTANTTNPYNSKFISLGQRITTNGVSKYKIHLTEQLNNILIRDSTNTKIGLVLSSNVNLTNSSAILNSTGEVSAVPSVSIITPRGTILYGANENVAEDKRMKLEIFYTKPKDN